MKLQAQLLGSSAWCSVAANVRINVRTVVWVGACPYVGHVVWSDTRVGAWTSMQELFK